MCEALVRRTVPAMVRSAEKAHESGTVLSAQRPCCRLASLSQSKRLCVTWWKSTRKIERQGKKLTDSEIACETCENLPHSATCQFYFHPKLDPGARSRCCSSCRCAKKGLARAGGDDMDMPHAGVWHQVAFTSFHGRMLLMGWSLTWAGCFGAQEPSSACLRCWCPSLTWLTLEAIKRCHLGTLWNSLEAMKHWCRNTNSPTFLD